MHSNNKNMNQNYLLIILFSGFLVSTACTKNPGIEPVQTTVVNYMPDNSLFANPERGFSKYTERNLGSGTGSLSELTLKQYRINDNITLIYRIVYLKNFRSTPLSDIVLTDLDNDFATMRKAGVKCILRFAYSSGETEPDAPFTIISQHLDQLKPNLEKNADVIAVMQAGFIGAWGEGYYSTSGLNSSGGRYQVYNKILETLPVTRMMEVRTPSYKREFIQRSTSITSDEAFTTQNIARVGFHNDCFLASSTDYGTYENATVDKAYINKECLYVPIGGETCPPSGVDPADGSKAQSEMRYLRWSHLNQDYYHAVNDLWKGDGSMDNIVRELGYRFQLLSGEYTDKVVQGGSFYARIILKNLGYAPLYNPRSVELVLKNTGSAEVYKVNLGIEPRLWKPNLENAIDTVVGIPNDMPIGEYELYLNLPDPEVTLYNNPAYSIRLANQNVWDETTGYNSLNRNIQIATANKGSVYSGSLFFKK
jgi:hypothetical protein